MSGEVVQPTRVRRIGRIVLFLILLLAAWSLLLRGCTRLCDVKPAPSWTASSGNPIPSHWQFLGFPISESVKLFDNNGNEVGVLRRAVGVSLDEERSEWVGVYPKMCVRRSDLTLTPPDDWKSLLAVYCDLQRQLKPKDFVSAELKTMDLPDQRLQVTFCEHGDHSVAEYRYTIDGGRGVPQEVAAAGAGLGIIWMVQVCWVVPLMIGLGVILTLSLAWCFFRDKPDRKYSLEAHCFGAQQR
jgi:hypothetical protein